MRQPVELEVGDPIDRLLAAAAAAARQHLDARQQLGERIGLGQVVVAAGAQALDAVVDLAERGQDQHRRLDALGAQFADDREAVALGQHAVDDQDVVLPVERQRQPLLAVRRLVGDMADLAEGPGDVVGRVAVVFDDQEAHGGPLLVRSILAKSGRPRLSGLANSARGGGLLRRPSTTILVPGGGDGCR